MGKYVLKCASRSGPISIGQKIRAIAAMKHEGKSAREVLTPLYEAIGRQIPEKPSQITGQWRQRIKQGLEADDPIVVKYCLEQELVEENTEEEIIPKRRNSVKI